MRRPSRTSSRGWSRCKCTTCTSASSRRRSAAAAATSAARRPTNPANPALNAHNNDRGELIDRGGVAGDPTIENVPAPRPQHRSTSSPGFPTVAANSGQPTPPPPAITDATHARHATSRRSSRACTSTAAASRRRTRPGTGSSSSPIRSRPIDVNGNKRQRPGDRRDDPAAARRLPAARLAARVMVVTDENEEAADPLTIAGQGWAFDNQASRARQSGGGAPRARSSASSSIRTTRRRRGRTTRTARRARSSSGRPELRHAVPQGRRERQRRVPRSGQRHAQPALLPPEGALRPLRRATRRADTSAGCRSRGAVGRPGVPATRPRARRQRQLRRRPGRAGELREPALRDEPADEHDARPLPPAARAAHAGPRATTRAIAGVPHQLLQATPGDECATGLPRRHEPRGQPAEGDAHGRRLEAHHGQRPRALRLPRRGLPHDRGLEPANDAGSVRERVIVPADGGQRLRPDQRARVDDEQGRSAVLVHLRSRGRSTTASARTARTRSTRAPATARPAPSTAARSCATRRRRPCRSTGRRTPRFAR